MITRFRSGASSMMIRLRPSASLMAARALALPMLARAAIRATGRVHFPVVWGFISNDGKHSQRVRVQMFSHIRRDDNGGCEKPTAPHYSSDGDLLFSIAVHARLGARQYG
jgi:hypothetical protein